MIHHLVHQHPYYSAVAAWVFLSTVSAGVWMLVFGETIMTIDEANRLQSEYAEKRRIESARVRSYYTNIHGEESVRPCEQNLPSTTTTFDLAKWGKD